MKELTIEQKAQRYDEAIERAKSLLSGNQLGNAWIYKLLPELKESEDDRIRKKIIATIHLYYGEPLEEEAKEMIAWLEKQGEHAKFRDSIQVGDKVTRNQDGMLVNLSQLNRVAKKDEKQGKDKVEPKFKVGDWVICCDYEPIQIIDIKHRMYYWSNGDIRPIEMVDSNSNIHHWTIQDAKDGDILFAKGSYFKEYTFIYSGMTEDNVMSTYCGFDMVHNNFDTKLSRFGRMEDFKAIFPATKEQCDLLFQKMHEAGYEWDAEKKELKKIEQKPAEWSEEDEDNLTDIFVAIDNFHTTNHKKELITFLKSIKERVNWKPSKEQMAALNNAILLNEDHYNGAVLSTLREQLKKLMEE